MLRTVLVFLLKVPESCIDETDGTGSISIDNDIDGDGICMQ